MKKATPLACMQDKGCGFLIRTKWVSVSSYDLIHSLEESVFLKTSPTSPMCGSAAGGMGRTSTSTVAVVPWYAPGGHMPMQEDVLIFNHM